MKKKKTKKIFYINLFDVNCGLPYFKELKISIIFIEKNICNELISSIYGGGP